MKNILLRQEFRDLPKNVNWFPGHMRKAIRELEEEISKANLFIEVRDARLPLTSHNPELLSLIPSGMQRLIVYNKIDLANEKRTLDIIKRQDEEERVKIPYMHISTKKSVNINKLSQFISQNLSPQFKTVGAWLMIGGIPNVGKSTIINSLRSKDDTINHSKRSGAKTGGIPCITKSITGFKIISDPPTFIMDTPGIIIPKIKDNTEDGLKLCATNAIRDGILDLEYVCDYTLYQLNKQQCFAYVNRYDCPMRKPVDNIHDLLHYIQLRFKQTERSSACDAFLRDFRDGTLGKITLDSLDKS